MTHSPNAAPAPPLVILFNPACSKCRAVRDTVTERSAEATYVEYLQDTPSLEALRDIARKLGLSSPRGMMRTREPLYRDLALDAADDERLFAAMIEHPILIERPIVIRGERAVVARPPEKLLELLDSQER